MDRQLLSRPPETRRSIRRMLAGGDLSRAPYSLATSSAAGAVPRGKALFAAARDADDEIYVSGTLGGSALGLATARSAKLRHLRPSLASNWEAPARASTPTAAMDLATASPSTSRAYVRPPHVCGHRHVPLFPGAFPGQRCMVGSLRIAVHRALRNARSRLFSWHPADPNWYHAPRSPKARVLLAGQPLAALGHDHFRS